MNWALHLIGAHPEVQAQIHKELDEIFGDDDQRDVCNSHLNHSKFVSNQIRTI